VSATTLGALTVARIEIAELIYSERAIEKMWDHRVTPAQLDDTLNSRYVVESNRSHRAAPFILYGTDAQGQCIAAPIVPTGDRLVWRVITAWYCKRSEAAKLR
jgi:hypothetical protein